MQRRVILVVLLIFVLTFPLGRALGGDKKGRTKGNAQCDPGKGVNFYSIEREMALGTQMAKEVEFQSRTIDDAVITEFVNRIGQNLARNSGARVALIIKLLDSDDVNAFALPGGFLFVNSGLLLSTHSESELAGVMAHEIAHVAARHWTKQATRNDILNIASMPLIFMAGWPGYAASEGLSLAMPLGILQFSRMYERQADSLGLRDMYQSGYDPTSFIDFFERIQSAEKKKPGILARFLDTHPMTASRIKAAQRQIQTSLAPKAEYVVNTSEFDDVHARLIRLHNHQRVDFDLPRLAHRPSRNANSDAAANPDSGERPTLRRNMP